MGVRCPTCGSDNPDGKKFCGDCGTALENRFPQCGADNPANKKFCGECGAGLQGVKLHGVKGLGGYGAPNPVTP